MTPEESDNIRRMNSANIEKIKSQVLNLQRTFFSIKKSGLHEDIIIAYLHDKTNCSKSDIRAILWAESDFYAKLAKLAEVKP